MACAASAAQSSASSSSRRVGWFQAGEYGVSEVLCAPVHRGASVVSVSSSFPPSFPPSPASVNLHHLVALFAFDIAAPVELTATPVHHLHFLCLEAAAAAHQLTAINGFRGPVTLAAHRAQHARRAWVVVAKVWTRVQVDQVFIGMRLELGVARHQDFGGAHLALLHLGGAVKLLFDDVSYFAEGRHGLPAGLHLAGA